MASRISQHQRQQQPKTSGAAAGEGLDSKDRNADEPIARCTPRHVRSSRVVWWRHVLISKVHAVTKSKSRESIRISH
ncbi:hypothetical protein N7509_008048 [Penicillium cosmopolitanum]|uniref:Uncharacterized protein n=1 Tax=Penicillium cosmopolitanum TaxID=1131564 RepID=A0A9X0B922_9EURO|nr:uncharacterized protein N7509_008048 [Penicillium cosmopolitanum]KAJ5392558.1 hypothetical protein N7509_008048 [Penicillium cosmopolitanum]